MHSDNQTNDKAYDEACRFIIKLGERLTAMVQTRTPRGILVAPDCGARFPGGLPAPPTGDSSLPSG